MITSKKSLRAVLPQLHNINVRKGHFDLTKIQQCIHSHCDGLDNCHSVHVLRKLRIMPYIYVYIYVCTATNNEMNVVYLNNSAYGM